MTFIAEPSGEYPERNFADDTQTEKTKKKQQSNMAFQVYQIAIPLLFLYKIVDCKIPLITWNVGEG